MKTRLHRYMTIGSLLLAASLGVQAAPYFTNKEGNLVWDKATGLVWMRCSLGHTWNGKACSGKVKEFTFKEAQNEAKSYNQFGGYGGVTDWKVPSIRQLASLRECSTGFGSPYDFQPDDIDIEDGNGKIKRSCRLKSLSPTIDSYTFPAVEHYYLSSSLNIESRGAFWNINFNSGAVHSGGNPQAYFAVRLVRASRLSNSETALSFPVNLMEKRLALERKTRDEREAADRRAKDERVAAENEARANRAQALKQLLALGARGLYLEAGKAQRNGSVTFVNTRYGASELYEMIVDKFPDSEYAVKATDQLTAMSRSSRDQSAAQSAVEQSNFNSRQRAYEACKIEMNSCYSRTNGKGNCYRDCERLR